MYIHGHISKCKVVLALRVTWLSTGRQGRQAGHCANSGVARRHVRFATWFDLACPGKRAASPVRASDLPRLPSSGDPDPCETHDSRRGEGLACPTGIHGPVEAGRVDGVCLISWQVVYMYRMRCRCRCFVLAVSRQPPGTAVRGRMT